ncbi:MAG: archease [Deltaproteobacteria bacterium]|nr:archease [Deltaproteobacteria bacterium]
MSPRYTIFDHTADLGVEIYGKTLPELFANAAFAVFDIITDLRFVKATEERQVVIEGSGWEDLLVNYLREILYLFNGEGLLLKECSIGKIAPYRLEGSVTGEFFDPATHRIHTEIKAVTYHQISVRETPDGWTGRVIFDV